MKYENPLFRKVRGSHLLMISCGYCKTDLLKYQKKGKGNVLRLHVSRIIEGDIDFSKGFSKNLKCISCGKKMGTMVKLKKKNKAVYKMVRSTFNTREID